MNPRDSNIAASFSSLGLTFPIWLFDPDDERRPRELASIQAGSRRACMSGWTLRRLKNGVSLESYDPSLEESGAQNSTAASFEPVLKRIRQDPSYDEDEYRVVYITEESDERTVDLSLYDPVKVSPSTVERLIRTYDDAIIWDKETSFDITCASQQKDMWSCVGLAIPIVSFEQLVLVAGISENDDASQPQRACFNFVDQEGTVMGIIYNGRQHAK